MLTVKLAIKIATNVLLVIYPLIIYFSLKYQHVNFAILFLMIVFLLRLMILPRILGQLSWFAKVLPCIGLFLAFMSWLFTQYQLLLCYPVVINFTFLALFLHSIKNPPTIIERFARMQDDNLSIKAIKYTRNVTWCWVGFFMLNGVISLVTCLLDDLALWTIYNGGISYILIGTLMGGEWLIRKRFQH